LRAFTLLLAAALLLAMLAAACGGDGEESTGLDPLEELNALADRATEGGTAKVTYAVTTTRDDDTTESEQTVVQRPPESRVDISISADEGESHATVINKGDRLYVCLVESGTEGCLDLESSGAAAQEALARATLHVMVEQPLAVELFDMPGQVAETTDDTMPLERSRRGIAGLDATCFIQELPNVETELCFSDDGLTLYWRYWEVSTDGVTRVFEATATSVSTDVTDEDFEPPYGITEGSRFGTSAP
jgi:hypothetical protein